jgi:hypothetical protein
MARLSRAEIFDPSEIVAVHTIERTVRRCYLLGDDHLRRWGHRWGQTLFSVYSKFVAC